MHLTHILMPPATQRCGIREQFEIPFFSDKTLRHWVSVPDVSR